MTPLTYKLRVLVTGATGYIGGRLVPKLIERGYPIRCLVRDPQRLQGRSWYDQVEISQGDALAPESLIEPMKQIDVAYYLVHSLNSGSGFHHQDIQAAENFSRAARSAGVKRIIYLGGLGDPAEQLSPHLKSRQATGETLRLGGVPVTEFQAGVIVGSGSVSFEMIRYLTERVPIMICPKWVYTMTQPIGIREVLEYLVEALEQEKSIGKVVQIGASSPVTYREMMTIYAQVRGLHRWMIPVPVLSPSLSSYWVNLVTPIPANIARPLIEGLRNESVVQNHLARELFPEIEPVSYRISVQRALAALEGPPIESTWYDALSTLPSPSASVLTASQEGMIMERRQVRVQATGRKVYQTLLLIGGNNGWFYMDWAWKIRGFVDRLLGGVGLRRGRRDPYHLRVGDALDFWRVEVMRPGEILRLRAEMKVPGRAWLQFDVKSFPEGTSELTQTAFFAPKGLWGWVYWYVLYPVHALIFSGLINQLRLKAEKQDIDVMNPQFNKYHKQSEFDPK